MKAVVIAKDRPYVSAAIRIWMPGFEPNVPGKKVAQMNKQDEIFRRYEKLVKVSKRESVENKLSVLL